MNYKPVLSLPKDQQRYRLIKEWNKIKKAPHFEALFV